MPRLRPRTGTASPDVRPALPASYFVLDMASVRFICGIAVLFAGIRTMGALPRAASFRAPLPPRVRSNHKSITRGRCAPRDASSVGAGQQGSSILGDVRHRMIDELGNRMARHPEQTFARVVPQQRRAGNRSQGAVYSFQSPEVGSNTSRMRGQHTPKMLPQTSQLQLAIGK